jgi:ubiquinone/menaquinone biosynthesis C-methylase UbiE
VTSTQAPPGYVPALRFRPLTRFFDAVLAFTLPERETKEQLVAAAGLKPGDRVLDIGAGTATLGLMLEAAQPEARVVGVARGKVTTAGSRVSLVEGVARALPFPAGAFDRVVSSLVFHHLSRDDKRRALAEARRVLRPGGTLHILDWGKAQDPFMRLAYLSVQLLDGFATTADNVRGDLLPLMVEAGFSRAEETRRWRTAFGTLSLYRAEAA